MNRLLKISWRNIWRNRLRSLVVIIAVGLGVWAGVLMTALSYSINEARKVKTIETQIGHVQIHHPDFVSEDDFNNYIDNIDLIQTKIANDPRVKARSYRSKSAAMISSPGYSAAVIINGVNPVYENDFSKLGSLLVNGKYFEGIKRNPLLIGEKLAQKFKLKIRSKVVITFIKGDIIEASSFRVAGIFKTGSGPYDEGNVFIRHSDIEKALGKCEINEIGLMLHDIEDSEALKQELSSDYTDLAIRDWKLLAPELGYADEMMGKVLYIFMMIILLALGLGIVNTMLMAVMERQKEIGVLLAVGMNKAKVFFMIMFESIQLSVIGAPFGLFAAYISVVLTGKYGIDLSVVAEGLESFGVDAVLYPEINTEFYFVTAFMVIITAILSALYPAYKALKITPANAIRGL